MSKSDELLTLLVGGTEYHGWTTAGARLSLETISGEFDLSVVDKWQGRDIRWPIRRGDACELRAGEDVLITGYVDKSNPAISAADRALSVSGRDATGDLVDCSAVQSPDQWSGRTLEEIARILCAPFNISVTAETATGKPFPIFKLQPGETGFAAIERLCRQRGVLAISDGHGGLLITAPGKGGHIELVLEEGKNILEISGEFDDSDRFSEYIIKGQQSGVSAAKGGGTPKGLEGAEIIGGEEKASKSPDTAKRAAAPASGRATDSGVTRYRPLVIVAEGEASGQSPQTRAEWEATVRAARATQISVKVQGLRAVMPGEEGGQIWLPNYTVRVISETLEIDDVLLIKDCAYSQAESGTITELGLTRPDAFVLLPEVPPAEGGKGKGKAAKLPEGTEVIK